MWELDHKQCWALKNWCFWTVVLKKTLESPLVCKKIKPVNSKENFTGRTFAEPEVPILWPRDVKSWLTGKDPDAEKDWRQEEKGTTEDEMAGWHHWHGREACHAAVHGVTKGQTQQLNNSVHNTGTSQMTVACNPKFVFFLCFMFSFLFYGSYGCSLKILEAAKFTCKSSLEFSFLGALGLCSCT